MWRSSREAWTEFRMELRPGVEWNGTSLSSRVMCVFIMVFVRLYGGC